ncbi:MAG: hypothetical protein Q8R65_08720 [Polynucleobacter sp.]|nr:hypothetical protein [Polynucleobacter sp.]
MHYPLCYGEFKIGIASSVTRPLSTDHQPHIAHSILVSATMRAGSK